MSDKKAGNLQHALKSMSGKSPATEIRTHEH